MFKFIFVFLGAVSFCVAGEYFIEISPANEKDFYKMKVGEIVRFEVSAYKKSDNENYLVNIQDKIWWQYNKRVLEKISSDGSSLTLKAINKGVSELCATSIIKNNRCQKTISVLVTE